MIGTSTAEQSEPGQNLAFRYGCYLFALLMILLAVYCRLRLLSVPLERDEGGFAYIGQRILDGVPPYVSGYSMKLTGIDAAYAMIMWLFGETVKGIHFGLLLVNLGNIYFLFLLARRIMPGDGAAVTVGVYALLSVSMNVLGVFAHATHFVTIFALAGMVSLMAGLDKDRYSLILLSGICLGLSITMKQNGLFFCLFALCYLGWHQLHSTSTSIAIMRFGIFVLGLAIPYLLICLYFIAHGLFAKFWFWTVRYVWEYVSDNNLTVILWTFYDRFREIAATTSLFWIIGGAGIAALLFMKRAMPERWFLLSFFLVSFLSIWPGSYFYNHYFVLVLPALSLLIGWATSVLPQLCRLISRERITLFLFGLLIAAATSFIYRERAYLFTDYPNKVSRAIFGSNPFTESQVIAEYIRKHTKPGTPIAVLGSEPQIYFYANRPAATRHIFMYSLTQEHPFAKSMQQEMIAEIEKVAPEYIVLVDIETSWMFEPDSEMTIVSWINRYLGERYEQVGLAELLENQETVYSWGKEAAGLSPRSDIVVSTYRKI